MTDTPAPQYRQEPDRLTLAQLGALIEAYVDEHPAYGDRPVVVQIAARANREDAFEYEIGVDVTPIDERPTVVHTEFTRIKIERAS